MSKTALQERILRKIREEDRTLRFQESLGVSLESLSADLVASITEDGLVPYVIRADRRFRTTPLATTLYSLWDAGLVSHACTESMQRALLFLRDNLHKLDLVIRPPHNRLPGDDDGWCVGEGVSVWATSMALISLLHTQFKGTQKETEIIARSAVWLSNQRDTSGGWKYQATPNCQVTIPMTALAVRALAKAQGNIPCEPGHTSALKHSIEEGIRYLCESCVWQAEHCWWEFNGKASTTATVWALQALAEVDRLEKPLRDAAVRFVLSTIPNDREWEPEQFVSEAGAKYHRHKNFYAFMPSHVPVLLSLGVPPLQPELIGVVKTLFRTRTAAWRIRPYDEQPCTFTHAMAIQAIVRWVRKVQTCTVSILVHKWDDSLNRLAAEPGSMTEKVPCTPDDCENCPLTIAIAPNVSQPRNVADRFACPASSSANSREFQLLESKGRIGLRTRLAIIAVSILCVVSVASTTALVGQPAWASKLHEAFASYSGSLGSWFGWLESNWVVSIGGSLVAGVAMLLVGWLWKRCATKRASNDE